MNKEIAIIGGGPSGLMAAEILSAKGFHVCIYEKKLTVGRKFLMAGRGGLNLTHSEDLNSFIQKYNIRSNNLKPVIENFPPQALRDWCESLGEKTFIGSSGRVFPQSFKASPLLRAWILRLENQNVRFVLNHDWQGWKDDNLIFKTPEGVVSVKADVTLLALGGASWPRLGADGSWVQILGKENINIEKLAPSNCGFFIDWSPIFSSRFAGQPLKPVSLSFQDKEIRGEFMITDKGIEGGSVYALSSLLRQKIYKNGSAILTLDLKPDLNTEQICERLKKPKSKLSMTNYLRKVLNLSDVAIGLLMETPDRDKLAGYSSEQMTAYIKSYKLILSAPFSLDRAISTAGGVKFNSIDHNFMLINKSGVFVAGEMLDWEAPTGGYLLQACMASGVYVAHGIISWLQKNA